MSGYRKLVWLMVLGGAMLIGEQATGQNAPAEENPNLSTPALKYFGRGVTTPVVKPSRRHVAPAVPQVQLVGGKPFQNITRPAPVTPYLSLDAVETSTGVPNYYSRVLPQIEQEQTAERQAAELRRLQRRVHLGGASSGMPISRNGGVPTTGHSSAFLNNGGYFPQAQRR